METENINPWLQIWTAPRKTLRALLAHPKRTIIWLAVLWGIISAWAFIFSNGDRVPEFAAKFHRPLYFIPFLIVGGILGVVLLYFLGWLYKWIGSWIGGKGNFTEVKCAVGWSNYPFIVANLLSILSYLSGAHPILRGVFAVLSLIFAIWALVIFFHLIGESHQFSAWKAVLCFIIAAIIVFIIFMIFAFIIPLLTPLF